MKTKRGRRVRSVSVKVRFLLAALLGLFFTMGCGSDDEDQLDFCPEVCGSAPSANTAHDVVAADFDEDGHLDLAVIGHLPVNPEEGLVVLKGDGRGGFTHMQSLAVGDHNHGVIAVDVNLDGHLDLVTTTASRWRPRYETHCVHIFFGDGAGDFFRHDTLKIEGISTGLLDGRAGDLNNDGFLDLVLSGVPGGQVMVLYGRENGEFSLPGVRFGGELHTRMSVVGDFNGDGALDVVCTNSGYTVSLLLGDGEGNLAVADDFFAGSGPRSVRKADMDGDGNLDVAVTTRMGNGVSILRGDGRGSFFPPTHMKTGEDPRAVRIGYLNRDGFPDVAVANALSQTVSFLYGDGNGGFLEIEDVLVGDAPILRREDKQLVIPGLKKPGTGDGIVGLEIADVNEDRREDVIASSTYDGQVFLLWSRCGADAK
jgi:hypothetical protein